jgi:hypothetical protein
MLQKMMPSIKTDRAAAYSFQFMEGILEIIAVYALMWGIFSLIGLESYVHWLALPIGILLAIAAQGLLTNNLRMHIV